MGRGRWILTRGRDAGLPDGAEVVTRNGVEIALLRDGPRDFAVFVRDGLTCILSGEVMDRDTLVRLAAWQADGVIEFLESRPLGRRWPWGDRTSTRGFEARGPKYRFAGEDWSM